MKRPLSQKLIWSAQLVLIVLCALALKFYYSTATPDDLLWILAPTTALVELLSGQQFEFESYAGYMSSDHRFVIAVPCAGVNFLITAFVMVALRRLWRERFRKPVWYSIPVAAAIAYFATIIANATRIWFALALRARAVEFDWLTTTNCTGWKASWFTSDSCCCCLPYWSGSSQSKPVSCAQRLIFPLLVYYAITLGVPLANGAYRQGTAFWEHSVFVLVLPLLLTVPLFVVSLVSQSDESPFRRVLSIPDSFVSRRWRTSGTSRRQSREFPPQC